MENIGGLHTEQRNPATAGLDRMSTADMLRVMYEENRHVLPAVEEALPQITQAAEILKKRMGKGGRLVYAGAGTSGRLGYMDAAECAPTYGVAADRVTCVMAGGRDAVFRPQEGLEDEAALAAEDLKAIGLTALDTVVAASASGRTPYCVGALDYARSVGAGAVAVSCNPGAEMSRHADVGIEMDTGPEVIMGSTRMNAGTAQKIVMNMLSTAAMVSLGRTWDNLMVCMQAHNTKVNNRAIRLFAEATGCGDPERAAEIIRACGGRLDAAVLAYISGASAETAAQVLAKTENIHEALREIMQEGEQTL